MDEEKPNPQVGPKKQSKEEATVHHPVAMDVEEGAVSNTKELVATPNSKEDVVARDAVTVADIVEVGTQDATMQEEEWRAIKRERLLPTVISSGEEEEEEEEEEEGHIQQLPPEMTLEEWLYYFHGDIPDNNDDNAAATPDAAAEEEDDGLQSDEEGNNMDDTATTMTQVQRNEGEPALRALAALADATASEPVIMERLGALADAPANSLWQRQAPSTGAAPRANSLWQRQAPSTGSARRANSLWQRQAPSIGAARRANSLWQRHAARRAFSSAGTEQEGASNNRCAAAMPTSPSRDRDPVNSTSQALFASASHSRAVFPGMDMEEQEDNGWYDSIAHDAQMMEEEEDSGLDGTTMPSPLHLPISMVPKEDEPGADHRSSPAAAAEEQSNNTWEGLTLTLTPSQSQLEPDEAGPSTRTAIIIQKPRVPPLADDEVPKFECGICMETLPIFDVFHGMPCPHRFCGPCMCRYIEGKVRGGRVPVPCPDPACGGVALHPEDCKKSIDFAVFCSWSEQLTERAISPGRRVYCPNRACGVMLESACPAAAGNGKQQAPAEVPCPACGRPMCGTCGLEWSGADGSGQHDCGEERDAMLVKGLAAQRHWKQCPRCRMLVERTVGCNTMTCRY
ncbi:unnamed protein product [Urochloa humidicola]